MGGAKTAAAEELRGLMRAVGIEAFANKTWGPKGAPNKGTVDPADFTQEMVRSDYLRFKDAFLNNTVIGTSFVTMVQNKLIIYK